MRSVRRRRYPPRPCERAPAYSAVHARVAALRGDHRRRTPGARRPRRGRSWSRPSSSWSACRASRAPTPRASCSTPWPAGSRRPASRSTSGRSTSTTLRADPDFPGSEAPRLEGHGVVGTASGDGEPALVLQGHVDVVPVGDLANWPGAATLLGAHRERGAARPRRLRHEGRHGGEPRRRPGPAPLRGAHRAPAGPAQRRQRGGRRPRGVRHPAARAPRRGGRHHRADERAPGHRERRRPHLPHRGRRSRRARQHPAGGRLGAGGVLAGAPRPARARGPPQRRPAPPVRRQPAALRHLGRHGAHGRLGQLGARPARRRGPDGRACWGRTRPSPGPRSRMPSPRPPPPTRGCATTHRA